MSRLRCFTTCFLIAGLGLAGCSSRVEPDPLVVPTSSGGEIRVEDPVIAGPVQPPASFNEAAVRTAPTEYALTVEDAVFLALRHNRNLRVQELEPVIADAFLMTERGIFDPEIFASYQYDEENVSETDRGTGGSYNVVGNDNNAAVGVRQTLPTGTEVEVSVEQGRSVSSRTQEEQSARLGLSVTQSLLRGFGPSVNLAAVRAAELARDASYYELAAFSEALLAEVETTYWEYVLAREEIAIFERSLAVAEQQRDEIQTQIEIGTLPPINAAAIKAEVARRQQDLIDARSRSNQLRLELAQLILPPNSSFNETQIDTRSTPPLQPEPIRDGAERIQLALQSRPDLKEAENLFGQNRLEVLQTRNGLLPRLDLFLDLGKTGYAQSVERSFRRMDDETYDLMAGVEFSMPLGNRAAEGRHLAARAARDQAVESLRNLRQVIQLDVLLALNEVERLRQQIEATAVTVELQRQAVTAEEDRFELGSGTSLQLAQAQRDLLEAEIARVGAIIQYRIALVDLYLAEGTLLERRGVTLPMPYRGGAGLP
ncbi:MAG: TolC family protein [Verrucomicrobiota bacterium JB022]|nr:TolC family protein [Verrucomicrobiota bacterium JB022]